MTASSELDPGGMFVATFDIDGTYEGVGLWEDGSLSPKWVGICRDLLAAKGDVFDYTWEGPLSHIRTRFTSAKGAAILTVYVDGKPNTCALLLRGEQTGVEQDFSTMFIDSLRGTDLVKAVATSDNPFGAIMTLKERPVMAVVLFPVDISDQDLDLTRELTMHLGYGYLRADGREFVTVKQ